MCGIIGALADRPVVRLLLEGLQRMEYRGYDSAGICVREGHRFAVYKREGKLANLINAVSRVRLSGHLGIGHTRWATHGSPTEYNAHPHVSDRIAVVHNGIIENHQTLRDALEQRGVCFLSETDSEVIPWLFSFALKETDDPLQAWAEMVEHLHGAFAIVGIQAEGEERLWFARRGSPLILGRGAHSVYAASDVLALAGLVDEVVYLEEGDFGFISLQDCVCVSADGSRRVLKWQAAPHFTTHVDKGGYSHFMEKEIHEQPRVLSKILSAYVDGEQPRFPDAPFLHEAPLPNRIVMVACGTSYHAALTARYWLERYLRIPVEVDIASEYRYRRPVIGPGTWMIALSQSGETADTLGALRMFKQRTPENLALAICNVQHSSLTREADGLIELLAGPEIGVASTKAFTAQLAVLALLCMLLARRSDAMDGKTLSRHLFALRSTVPGMAGLLDSSHGIEQLAQGLVTAHSMLYLGRGPCYPLALEGALKMKEISYIHAEGYAAGEMKHGPIALIDASLPVLVIAPRQYHLEKVLGNLQEVKARGAKVIMLTDLAPQGGTQGIDAVIRIPEGDYFSTPLLVALPLQMLAYYAARAKGTDVDQPRNLAKSVTVE